MATLSVQEAMGFKVDREAVATLVLPQLWAMSMGPCLWSLSCLCRSLTSCLSAQCGPVPQIHGSHKEISGASRKRTQPILAGLSATGRSVWFCR